METETSVHIFLLGTEFEEEFGALWHIYVRTCFIAKRELE